MEEKLRFDIDPPEHGWAAVRLRAPAVSVDIDASYTPRDSITELASAASALLAGLPTATVRWNTEPREFDFDFKKLGELVRLEVREFQNHWRGRSIIGKLVAVIESDVLTVVIAIWRGLRRLQGHMSVSDFSVAWRHEFPTSIVDRLSEQLRSKS
jgi:hypothetical protein